MGKTWILFHCEHDHSWVVSVLEDDLALGVAECPDEPTARAVLPAMRDRDKTKAPPGGGKTV